MAKYAYVKAGLGASTTDTTFTSLQAEAFGAGAANLNATNCYGSMVDAITYGALTAGDYILCSSSHIKDYGVSTALNFPDDIYVISVDDTDGSSYLSGAHEKATGGIYDLTISTLNFGKHFHSKGIDYSAGDDLQFIKGTAQFYIGNCELACTGTHASDVIKVGNDGIGLYLDSVDLSFGAGGQALQVLAGGKVIIDGGSVNSTCTVGLDFAGNGGATVDVSNYDYSSMTSGDIVRIAGINDDTINANFKRCKLPASGVNKTSSGKVYARTQEVNFWSCDNGDGYYYFHHTVFGGVIEQSTAIKRTGGATYDGSTGFSAEFQPNSDVIAYIEPLRFRLGDYPLDLTSANTLTFHLAMQDNTTAITPSTITNDKYWIELVQNDATDNALGITIDTKPTDVLTTPSALANVATTWTGRTLTYEDEFQIPVTTTVVTGLTTGQVTAYLCVAEHVSTREIYACPSPVIT